MEITLVAIYSVTSQWMVSIIGKAVKLPLAAKRYRPAFTEPRSIRTAGSHSTSHFILLARSRRPP